MYTSIYLQFIFHSQPIDTSLTILLQTNLSDITKYLTTIGVIKYKDKCLKCNKKSSSNSTQFSAYFVEITSKNCFSTNFDN